MRLPSAAIVSLLLAAIPALSWADVSVTPVITQEAIQEDFNAAKYPECLQKISMLLSGSVNRPTGADRAKLMSLKAECLLQQKQAIAAADAFIAAAPAYGDDKAGAAIAAATGDLIKKSSSLQYTPRYGADKKPVKPADKTPLPILDAANRPAALAALFNDQLIDQQAAYKTLAAKPSLPAIEEFAPKLKELDSLELASGGTDPQSAQMQKDLSNLAKTSMDAALTQLTNAVNSIATSAATMVNNNPNPTQGGGGGGGGGRRGGGGMRGQGGQQQQQQQQPQHQKGLTDTDRTNLNNDLATAKKFPPAIKSLITDLATDPNYFQTETTNAATLIAKIDSVLAGHY